MFGYFSIGCKGNEYRFAKKSTLEYCSTVLDVYV